MIGRLTGTLAEQTLDGTCVLDVQGVGYEVFVPIRTIGSLPHPPELATLYVHTHVREDSLTLFAFSSLDDRAAFRTLLSVSSVGPKLAMSIMSRLTSDDLARAVSAKDKTRFKGISGVGKKTIERMMLDLPDKLPAARMAASVDSISGSAVQVAHNDVMAVVCGALVQMGYKQAEAERAMAQIGEGADNKAPEMLLREALSALA